MKQRIINQIWNLRNAQSNTTSASKRAQLQREIIRLQKILDRM